jgi:hypothetical protein
MFRVVHHTPRPLARRAGGIEWVPEHGIDRASPEPSE